MKTRNIYIISVFIGFIYACSDEIHQYFVKGRSSEIRDVLIDTSGVVLGAFICMLICLIFKKKIKAKNKE